MEVDWRTPKDSKDGDGGCSDAVDVLSNGIGDAGFGGLSFFREIFDGLECSAPNDIGRLDGIELDAAVLGSGRGEGGVEDNKLVKISPGHSSGILVL